MRNARASGRSARIAIMRALDGHSVDWEAGYTKVKDSFKRYSYSVWASGEHQRWIIYGDVRAYSGRTRQPENRTVPLALQCGRIKGLPEAARLLSLTRSFSDTSHAPNAGREFKAEQTGIGNLLALSAHGCKSPADRSCSETAMTAYYNAELTQPLYRIGGI